MTMGAIFAVVFYVFAKPLVYAFISDGNLEAVEVGVDFLHIVTPFYIFLSIKLRVDGVQRGAARMLQFMIATLSDLFLRWCCRLCCRRFSGFAACGIRGRSAGSSGLCCRRRCTWFGRVN